MVTRLHRKIRGIPVMRTLMCVLLATLVFPCLVLAETHVITSLPYTFDANDHSSDAMDTLVLAGTRLSSSGSGITLQALYGNELTNVLVNLGTDTISYGEGGGGGVYGIRTVGTSSYYPHEIEIRGGFILHNTPDTTVNDCQAIDIRGHDILVKDVTATVRGYNGQVFYAAGSQVYNDRIEGGHFTSYVTGFDSRCDYDACVVDVTNLYTTSLTDNGADYHIYIKDLTIDDGPHMGIAIRGREGGEHYGTAWIEACSVRTDARNSFYPTNDGLCHSTSNPYGICFRHAGPGARIVDNVVTSGTNWGGNRGIMIEYGWGTDEKPIVISGNLVDVHEGPNVEYGDALPSHGLRIRYSPHRINVLNNTFICTGDNDPSTEDIGTGIHPVRLSCNTGQTNVLIRNNTIRAISLSGSGVACNGVTFDGIDYPDTYRLEYNHIVSSGTIYKFGDVGSQDVGPTGVTIVGDTVAFATNTIDPHTFYLGHLSNDWNCTENVACDIVYQNGTSDEDVEFSNGGTADIAIQRTLSVKVNGDNGLPVPGAEVTVTNNYGRTVLTGVTGSSGTVTGPVSYRWESRTQTDSTQFNGFSVKCKKGADSVVTSITVNATSESPTVTLPVGGVEDVIPPAGIDDLGAAPGTTDGAIRLTWTAPGDDGNTGIAAEYAIRYSEALITENNWAAADQFGSPPQPLQAGTIQSAVVSGLEPGTTYFLGMRTYDWAGGASVLSNIVSEEAYLSIGTGGDDTTGTGGSDTLTTNDDAQLVLASPVNDSTVSSTTPTLIVVNADSDPANLYYYQVARDTSFTAPASTSPAVPQETGTTTAWTVASRLEVGPTYYWRARVNDGPYSEALSFVVEPSVYAYPNPYQPDAVGNVTFNELPTGSDMVVMTVNGDVVRRWVNIDGGQVAWDGTNQTGNPVASGTYLWFVENTDTKGKLILVR